MTNRAQLLEELHAAVMLWIDACNQAGYAEDAEDWAEHDDAVELAADLRERVMSIAEAISAYGTNLKGGQ